MNHVIPDGWLESFEDDEPAGSMTFRDRKVLQSRRAKTLGIEEIALEMNEIEAAHGLASPNSQPDLAVRNRD